MPDLLKQGSDWLESQRHAHLAHEVVYTRGAQAVTLLATVGRTQFDLADDTGVLQRIESRDFLVRASDLTLGEPLAGDRITDGAVYEVMAPGGGEAPWRYSDPYRRTLRIHTKLVEPGEVAE